jgi:hypothetical protein
LESSALILGSSASSGIAGAASRSRIAPSHAASSSVPRCPAALVGHRRLGGVRDVGAGRGDQGGGFAGPALRRTDIGHRPGELGPFGNLLIFEVADADDLPAVAAARQIVADLRIERAGLVEPPVEDRQAEQRLEDAGVVDRAAMQLAEIGVDVIVVEQADAAGERAQAVKAHIQHLLEVLVRLDDRAPIGQRGALQIVYFFRAVVTENHLVDRAFQVRGRGRHGSQCSLVWP